MKKERKGTDTLARENHIEEDRKTAIKLNKELHT